MEAFDKDEGHFYIFPTLADAAFCIFAVRLSLTLGGRLGVPACVCSPGEVERSEEPAISFGQARATVCHGNFCANACSTEILQ